MKRIRYRDHVAAKMAARLDSATWSIGIDYQDRFGVRHVSAQFVENGKAIAFADFVGSEAVRVGYLPNTRIADVIQRAARMIG